MIRFDEWEKQIVDANTPAPRTYQDGYKQFLTLFPQVDSLDKAAGFRAGWFGACDALANRLVEWLDEPAGDDVAAFLGFVDELRKGDLTSE